MRGFFSAVAAFVLAASSLTEAHSLQRNPLHYISRVETPIIHTPAHRVHSHSEFDITFHLDGSRREIRLSLQPNHDVLAHSATVQYLDNDGNIARQEPLRKEDHRIYKGDAFIQYPGRPDWINAGWARITVLQDGQHPLFEGSFRINGETHRVKTSASFRQTQHADDPDVPEEAEEYLVVWKDTDIKSFFDSDELKRSLGGADSSCSSDTLGFNVDTSQPIYTGLDARGLTAGVDAEALFGRDIDGLTGDNGAGVNLASTVGSTTGCPTTRKVALLGIAVDCTYRASFKTESDMRSNILDVVSTASRLYEDTLNISLGLQNLTIVGPECPGSPPTSTPWNVPCGPNTSITSRLNLFSAWRGQFTDNNAYWTLLSTCPTDGAVGLAWLGQLCRQGSQAQGGNNAGNETIAGANVVVRTDQEWEVFAHETGHTFGAVHDCTSTTCADGTSTMQQCCPLSSSGCDARGQFIMNPSTSSTITRFSPCTIGNICTGLLRKSVDGSCMTDNRNVPIITEAQCGNGIVEPGEDCDCGGSASCAQNNCCDATTCKYRGNAVCDPTNEDCCTNQCQFAASGSVCRASTGSCDPQETCPGTSANCPEDSKAPDGDACGASGAGLTCASGQCTSRDLQCRTMVGAMLTNNDTYACNSQGCRVSCQSPELGQNTFGQTCVVMQQYFLDGTPCDGGGKCNRGQCQGSDGFRSFLQLLRDNQNIVIPVCSVVGGLLVIAILSCCWSSCRRRRRRSKMAAAAKVAAANRGPPPPQSSWNNYNNGSGSRHGQPYVPNVPMPPPTYGQSSGRRSSRHGQGHWQGGPSPPSRVPTTRYA
ncbi:fungal ADAM-like protein [Microdochium trichocladiopsis]|uniref:Disintegrin and metalloproteinase domain-containing protein B n=1 Tax=Microdochium trichocladiopsis TaxID=1682393 RepID=A0A9P8YHK7_9PEZI|nr:fungal ADAM-like protein [Microdochium trichocladiopsis]KAH7040148.1 fungal ADAM-like protein [Microdochium trichocladiopsis]